MKIVDNLIILCLIALAFYLGKRISDSYNERQIQMLEYQLRMTAAEKGVGYVAAPQRKRYMPIGQPFMDKLHENGRATQRFSPADIAK